MVLVTLASQRLVPESCSSHMANVTKHRQARVLDLHLHTHLDLAYRNSDWFTMYSDSGTCDISLATPSSMSLSSLLPMVDSTLKCNEAPSSHWIHNVGG